MRHQLFATKPLRQLLEEMKGEDRLRRVLGPIQLTSLGVGAIIGAGIFVATGAAARNVAGPALMLSYVVAGMTCIFAALCYAEFASMVPVAGSAYTYAYATLGELFAWIIGWDLILEYAVGSATVANGWSGYFQSVLAKFGLHLPAALAGPPIIYDTTAGHFVQTAGVVNLPAILIVALVTAVLVKGIQESAGFNTTMVFLKVTVVVFVILVEPSTSIPKTGRRLRPTACRVSASSVNRSWDRSMAAGSRSACSPARPSSFSLTSVSTRCPHMRRKRRIRRATYRLESSRRC
jgi:APA family basic amino acid/polyamine antiporter